MFEEFRDSWEEWRNKVNDALSGGGGSSEVRSIKVGSTVYNPVLGVVSLPAYPSKVSDLTNDAGYTSNVGTVTGAKIGTTEYAPVSGVLEFPAYPSKVSDLTNDAGYTTNEGTVTGAKIGTTSYSPVSGVLEFPAYPSKVSDLTNDAGYTTNEGTVTGAKIGTTSYSPVSGVLEFPAYPSKVSELTNDAGYTTNTGTVTSVKVGDTGYAPIAGVVSLPEFVSDPNYVHIDVDDELSTISTNPVENGVITTALNNEVATRAALGAHNLLGIEEWCEQAGTTCTKSGNAYTVASVYALKTTPFVFSDSDVDVVVSGTIANGTAVAVIIKLLNSSDELVDNSSPNGEFELRGSGCKIVLDFFASDGTAVLTDAMVCLESDADSNYQPYGKTNVELTEGLSSVKQALANEVSARAANGAHNLAAPLNSISDWYGVTISTDSNGISTISGTCTTTGGRTFLKGNSFLLPKGSYIWSSSSDLAIDMCLQKTSDTSVILLKSATAADASFTLSEDTYVYVGINVATVTYNNVALSFMIRLASDSDTIYQPFAMTNQQLTNEVVTQTLYFTSVACAATTGNFATITDDNITADHVLVDCVFANSAAIETDVTWTSSDGSFVLNGTCSTATTATITLAKKGN